MLKSRGEMGSNLPKARRVAQYVFHDVIASGGMASVHLGRHVGTAGFSRTVAIKSLHDRFADEPHFVSTLLDEARIASRIHHPNVVSTLDILEHDDHVYVVMEYIPGEALSRLIRNAAHVEEPVPIGIAVSIIVGVLHGLHAAHEACSESGEPLRIVHRDVSPQNILVGTDGLARVLDFGVAQARGRLQSTERGQLKGKLGYASPEQLLGEVDRQTDVWATGVVLWEALTGRRLFRSDSEAETVMRVMQGTIAPPSAIVADVPPELDVLVMRALERNRTLRFATARQFAIALEEQVGADTSRHVGEWVEARASEALRRRARQVASLEREAPGGEAAPRRVLELFRRRRMNRPALEDPAESTLRTMDAPPHVLSGLETEEPRPPSQESVLTVVTPATPARTRPSPRRVIALAVIGAIVAGATFVPLSQVLGHRQDRQRVAPSTEVGVREPTPSDPLSSPATAAAPAASSASAPAPPKTTASTTGVRTEPPLVRSKPTKRTTSSSAAAAKSCEPPTYRGPDGLFHFKRECLQEPR